MVYLAKPTAFEPMVPADGVITATELLLHLEEQLMPLPAAGGPRQTPIFRPLRPVVWERL